MALTRAASNGGLQEEQREKEQEALNKLRDFVVSHGEDPDCISCPLPCSVALRSKRRLCAKPARPRSQMAHGRTAGPVACVFA